MLKKVGGASPTPPKEGLRRGAKTEDGSVGGLPLLRGAGGV